MQFLHPPVMCLPACFCVSWVQIFSLTSYSQTVTNKQWPYDLLFSLDEVIITLDFIDAEGENIDTGVPVSPDFTGTLYNKSFWWKHLRFRQFMPQTTLWKCLQNISYFQ
jgi:hypothetical protein